MNSNINIGYLAFLSVEDCRKCTSHCSTRFLITKLVRVGPMECMQNAADRRG